MTQIEVQANEARTRQLAQEETGRSNLVNERIASRQAAASESQAVTAQRRAEIAAKEAAIKQQLADYQGEMQNFLKAESVSKTFGNISKGLKDVGAQAFLQALGLGI